MTISLDTSGLTGTAAQLALDFVGGPSPSNTVTITNFLTDGALGVQTPTGGSAGTLPGTVTLSDGTSFFNELLANMTLGSFLSFQVDTTNLGPAAGSFPDEFSLFLYDSGFNSLIATSDPTGANAIATIDLTGAAITADTLYTSDATLGSPVAAPEPSSLLLLATFAGLLLLLQRRSAGRFAAVVAALLGSLSAQTNIATPVAADNSITVSLSGMRLNRSTNTYDSVVTLTNTSAAAIGGPFYLAVSGIDVSTVTFYNSAGLLPNKLPYIPLSVSQLAPNTPVVAGIVKFSDPQNVPFHINAGVWDAASLPQFGVNATPMTCYGVPAITNGPGPAGYEVPVDSVGRTATCVPGRDAWLPLGDNWVQCTTSGGSAPPASCAFDVLKLPFSEVCISNCGPGGSGPPAGTADVSLRPCPTLTTAGAGPPAGLGVPAGFVAIPIPIQSVTVCDFAPPGTSTFSLVNNGPYTAYNVRLALAVPLQYTAYSMQFDHPAACTIATPALVNTAPGTFKEGALMPNGSYYFDGAVFNCFFPSIPSGQIITAHVGVDLPTYNGSGSVASLYAQVGVDSTQNTDPDLTNNSIAFYPSLPPTARTPPPPVSPTCSHNPDDHTFGVLLDTCGVPSLAVEIVTGVFLGGAAIIGTGGITLLELGVLSPLDYAFNAAVAGGGIK